MSVLRAADGRVRSGWVIATFTAIAAGVELGAVIVSALLGLGADRVTPSLLFTTAPTALAGVTATLACWRLFGEPTGLTVAPARPVLKGFALGALAITLACLPAFVRGAQSVSLNPEFLFSRWLLEFLALAPAAIGEELLLRGLGLQALRRGVGDVPAVVLSSALFGAMHLMNPHASWVAALIITLVGLWFGAAMVRSGSLWLPMGLHLGWNFFEGCVLGQPVSGLAPGSSVLRASWDPAPGFWSGGDFGPEASGWTAVVLLAAVGTTLAWRPGRPSALT